MSKSALPPIFLSHGSPMIAIEPGEAGAFMQRLGPAIDATFGRPKAILAISAHTTARAPLLLGAAQHETIHDFGGFPQALFEIRYDAPGAPAVAARAEALLREHGVAVQRLDAGGLDHGIWTALRHVYPNADVPIVPLAWVPSEAPARLFAMGEALAALSGEGVLVLGSGSITHNLRLFFGGRPAADAPEMPESAAFRGWLAEHAAARDWPALFDYRARAPHAAFMHPSDEHLLPWFVAAGAGGREARPLRIHDGVSMACLGMDAYAFGEAAGALHDALGAGSSLRA
jgi:4,5-DOPA dioxygenase extradiol